MVRVCIHLSHYIHPIADRPGMALGAVTRQSEGRVLGNRPCACVTSIGIATLLIGMTVGETVLMTVGASSGYVVAVAGILGKMFAVRQGVADIADTIEGL